MEALSLQIEHVAYLLARLAHAATTTSRHVCRADARKARCVFAEVVLNPESSSTTTAEAEQGIFSVLQGIADHALKSGGIPGRAATPTRRLCWSSFR
jgi:hypothetical protein